jgi:hypothetical protein
MPRENAVLHLLLRMLTLGLSAWEMIQCQEKCWQIMLQTFLQNCSQHSPTDFWRRIVRTLALDRSAIIWSLFYLIPSPTPSSIPSFNSTLQEFAEPKLDSNLVTRFIPALMSLIVDDQVRSLNSKLPPDERESATIVIEHSGPPPDAYQVRSDCITWQTMDLWS